MGRCPSFLIVAPMGVHRGAFMGRFRVECTDESSPAGVLHGQRVSSAATCEASWPSPSSGRPATNVAVNRAEEGQWQAFASERLDAAEKRRQADQKSRSEAGGGAGDDGSAVGRLCAPQQQIRQAVSSPGKGPGGDKAGGWSTVRESVNRSRVALAKDEPLSPSQEAEKRRKLRAGDIRPLFSV